MYATPKKKTKMKNNVQEMMKRDLFIQWAVVPRSQMKHLLASKILKTTTSVIKINLVFLKYINHFIYN